MHLSSSPKYCNVAGEFTMFLVQRELHHRVKLDILRELGSPDKLRKSLDVVEIVIGFLSSGGGKPKSKLLSYLRKLKMERRRFSEKVCIF